ncbi:MAG: carboxypeptidase-like regulatory domain-containing protein [Bryobacterales bacterium]
MLISLTLSSARGGQVSGVVVAAQGGEPLASVEMTLGSVNDENGRQRGPIRGMLNSGQAVRTALDGRFVFDNVEPGEYVLGATKAGYEAGGRIARRVVLTDSQPTARLSLSLRRSPSIEGRVLDADGDPVAEARVELRAWAMSETRRTLRAVRAARTDDRGQYRLDSLPPGAYYVYLNPQTLGMRQGGVLYETSGVYYPQGATPAEGAQVRLGWDRTLEGVDLVAGEPGGAVAAGTALHEDGTPCPECSVVVFGVDGLPAASTRMADTGRFAIYGLPSGEYAFTARGPRGSGLAIEKVYLPDERPVEMTLRLAPGQQVSGFVSIENAEEDGELPLDRATLRLLPADPMAGGIPTGARVSADGTFTIEQAPQGLYRALAFGLPANGYVRRVLYGGVELEGGMVRVTPNGPITGLQLVASFDGGAVQGTAVESKGGEPAPPDGIAILLPQQTEGASDTPSMAGYQSGDFRFGGVAPGEYLLFSVPRSFAWDWSDPALLAELRRRATKVKVKAGETVTAEAPYLPGP